MKKENQLLILILFSLFVFIVSSVFHFCSVFNVFQPYKALVWILWVGKIIVVYASFFVSYKIKSTVGKKNYRKIITSVFPEWFIVTTGFVLIYAISSSVFFMVKGNLSNVFPADSMAISLITTEIFYIYRAMKKSDVEYFSSGEAAMQNGKKESVKNSLVKPNSSKAKTTSQFVNKQKKEYIKEKKRIAACPKCKGLIYVDSLHNGENICPHCKKIFMVKGK